MRSPEQISEIFNSLPNNGIGIHGTNLARARNILDQGFDPDALFGKNTDGGIRYTHYLIQLPTSNPDSINDMLERLYLIIYRAQYASMAEEYKFGSDEKANSTPAIVAFLPKREITKKEREFFTTMLRPTWDTSRIPNKNILGIVELHREKGDLPQQVLTGTAKILIERKIISVKRRKMEAPFQTFEARTIDSAGPQQLRKE